MDFIDTALTSSSHLSKVTCCLPDKTSEVATCGQGASCAGQCSALGASLCPSGNCTDDPRTCEISFKTEATEDQRRSQLGFAQARNNHEHSDVTLSGSDLKYCTNSKHRCRVRAHPECCLYSNCLNWRGRRKACKHLDYFTGNDASSKVKEYLCVDSRMPIWLTGKSCPFPGSLPHGTWS